MVRIRVHGRGGEGAVTFAHILCASATYDGKFGQSCMAPAFERRGAPVEAFARIGDRRVAERGAIPNPDIVVVLNPALIPSVNVEAGLNDNGRLVVNSAKDLGLKHETNYIDAQYRYAWRLRCCDRPGIPGIAGKGRTANAIPILRGEAETEYRSYQSWI